MSALATMFDTDEEEHSLQSGVSATSDVLSTQWTEARRHLRQPVSRATPGQRFNELAATWREQRGFSSSLPEMLLQPAYQQIIALGWRVVPSILVELQRAPDHWFWALRMITGANPVSPGDEGNVRAMSRAWIQWADRQGFID